MINFNKNKILIITGGSTNHLLPFVDAAEKIHLDVTIASFLDLSYETFEDDEIKLNILGQDVADFGVIYVRLVGKHFEELSLLQKHAQEHQIKIVDKMFGKSGLARLPIGKSLETKLLSDAGIPLPKTVFCKANRIKYVVNNFDNGYVIKDTLGKQGHGIWSPVSGKELNGLLKELLQKEKKDFRRFLVQEFVEASQRTRVLVIGGKAVAAITRPTRWRNRFSKSRPVRAALMPVPETDAALAIKAAKVLDVDIAGVDILHEDKTQRPYVLEVNSAPRWQSIKTDTGINVEAEILKYLRKVLIKSAKNKKGKKILMDKFMDRVREMGFQVKPFKSDRRVFKLSKGDKSVMTIGKHLPFNSHVSYEIARRKHLTKQVLNGVGIKTPKGILTGDWSEVKEALAGKKMVYPLVVKPDTSLTGYKVFVKVEEVGELKDVFMSIKKEFGEVLVEEYAEGQDYRFLVLDGKILAIAKRVPPCVVGDGAKTIKGLIKEYQRQPDITLKEDDEINLCLSKQGYQNLKKVPQKGVKIWLRRNASISTGGIVEDVTDLVNDRFKDIAVKASRAIGLRFSGIDLLIDDIENKNSDYAVIEVNCDPGYDLHSYPKTGRPYDATADILKSLLGEN